jgi:uncharacterized membrane protein
MMEKTWRCTVCGYLHTGENPPEECPVCGVDASHFELVGESQEAVNTSETTSKSLSSQVLGFLDEMKATFVPHAVAAHFPNGLLPTCVLFLLLTLISGNSSFEATTFHLLLVAFISIPVTIATGLISWKKKYAGNMSPIFRKKMILAALLFFFMIVTIGWRWSNPEVLSSGGFSAFAYSILILIMLGCVTLLGHYGGMLVFSKHVK